MSLGGSRSRQAHAFLAVLALAACSSNTSVVGTPDAATAGSDSGVAGATADASADAAGGTAGGGQDAGGSGGIAGGAAGGQAGSGGGGTAGAGGQASGGTGGQNDGGLAGSGGASGAGGTAGSGGGDACVPQPCANDGKTCGELPDGCGGMAKCLHTCASNEVCQSNQCVAAPCTEYTQTEINQICQSQANCGWIPRKCTADAYWSCRMATPCAAVYQWCQLAPDQSGTCEGCTRKPTYDPSDMSAALPFAYFCPADFRDGIQDDGETDVDCGGPHNVKKCSPGKCDTATGHCSAGKPAATTCSADSDCSQACQKDSDCSSQACVSGLCANTAKPPAGCSYASTMSSGIEFYCPDSQNGCYRSPSGDSNYCSATPGKPYYVGCDGSQTLWSVGCTQAWGMPNSASGWCCGSTTFP